jgi:hypothetical protein
MRETDAEHTEARGFCDNEEQVIAINVDYSPERQLEVLLHEIVHAAWDVFAMPLNPDEETVARFIGSAFAAAIRANKNLLPVLTALRNGEGFLGD